MHLITSIPHSGEKIPDICPWLDGLEEKVLMCDVDRYVDRLYLEILKKFNIPYVLSLWHRFAVDLNRLPSDIDEDSVLGSLNKSGHFPRGFHWSITTKKEKIMPMPMSQNTHEELIKLIYEPFHRELQGLIQRLKKESNEQVLHLDLHSMPSMGTLEHRDPGEKRADIVISDSKGKSAQKELVDLVCQAYTQAGFKVAYNWPYYGGRLTELYGKPEQGHHTVQVELNRSLYMNEETKKYIPHLAEQTIVKLEKAISIIYENV